MSPIVSVVTVFHNRVEEVAVSIGSLLAQTYDTIEIIAIDDGSTDGTAEALLAFQDPRLKVIIQKNRGFTATMDAAVREAAGQYLAVHGAGDISMPTRIERQAGVLAAHPEVVVVGCRVSNDDGDIRPDKTSISTEQPLSYFEVVRINPITHGEAMFRVDTYKRAGGYRAFFQYAQDHDLWLRMDRIGKFWSIKDSLYIRRRFKNSVNADPLKVMIQGCYGEFAEQCARSVDENGKDLLDRYGNAAGFMFDPTPKHMRKVTSLGIKALVGGDEKTGQTIIEAGVLQKNERRMKIAGLLSYVSVHQTGFWQQVARPVTSWILNWHTSRGKTII